MEVPRRTGAGVLLPPSYSFHLGGEVESGSAGCWLMDTYRLHDIDCVRMAGALSTRAAFHRLANLRVGQGSARSNILFLSNDGPHSRSNPASTTHEETLLLLSHWRWLLRCRLYFD